MNSEIAIEFENVGKQYRLGRIGTGTLAHDLNRWLKTSLLGKEDPYLMVGEINDRAKKGESEYVWALKDISLKIGKGDVVGILNSDDFFSSDDILATVASNITDVDAVYADIHFVRPDNLSRCVRHYSSKNFRPWTVRFGYMPAHPSFFVRRHIYEQYGLYSLDYKIASDFDMMVRLFCKHKIRARYIARDFVTMRTGGISTSNLSHRILITREDARACRANGIYSNFILCSVKYITKVFEFL